MQTLIFDISKHLSFRDQQRLKAAAKRQKVSVDDYIESTLKAALFAPSTQPAARPARRMRKGEPV